MKRVAAYLAIVMASFFLTQKVQAVEWMTGSELINHCKEYEEHPTSMDGIVCASYIQGFLGGAEVTDGVVVSKFRNPGNADRDSFENRAFNSRVTRRFERFGPTSYADYCLPKDIPTVTVIKEVIDYIAAHPESASLTAQNLVYNTLKEFHPCED